MPHSGTNRLISPQDIRPYISANSTLIVGLSGGPDSVCLLHLLAQLKDNLNLKIIAAHLDHGWRQESTSDAIWCQDWCNAMNIPIVVQTASSLAYEPKYNGSKEDLGRKLRRHFFESVAQKYQAQAIMLAHHLDDQIETFFIRLLRGSSTAGLTSMKQQDGLYLRPLLLFSKQEILHYLATHELSFLVDASNQSNAFLRNRIRNDLLPTLSTIDSRWPHTIPNCINQLQQTNDFVESQAQSVRTAIASPINHNMINIDAFLKQHIVIQHKIVLTLMIEQQIPFTPSTGLFSEIIRFLKSTKHSQHVFLQTYLIIKKQGYFYFSTL